MNNIIITPAIGLPANDIDLFLASLRRFYNGEILFFVGKQDHLLKEKLIYYNSSYIEVNTHKHEIITKRYGILIDILKKKQNIDNILFCDSRDIYFQSNPFKFLYEQPLNFFSEDASIEDCVTNSQWMKKTLGLKVFNELKKKKIVCCGTVMGKKDAFIKYAIEMDKMSKKFPYKKRIKYLLTFRRDKEGRGCDQSYAAYLIYKKILENIKIYSNSLGPVATVFHLNDFNFNKNKELINNKNEPYVIVHQYDKRWEIFKDNVNNLKKKLNIN